MKDRISTGQRAMTAAVVIAVLFGGTVSLPIGGPMIWMFGGGGLELLLDAFGRQPFRVGGVFLFVCAVLFVFFLGARTASHTGIYFISRIILLVISAVAGVVCLW